MGTSLNIKFKTDIVCIALPVHSHTKKVIIKFILFEIYFDNSFVKNGKSTDIKML